MKHICEWCEKTFNAPPSQNARFCNRKCYDDSRYGIFQCTWCHKQFSGYKSHRSKWNNVFCSHKCHMKWMKSDPRNHPSYKHGRASYRKLVEIETGIKLKSCDIIHHKNGDRTDNSISNLQITDRSEHCVIHKPRLGTGK